MTYRTIYSTHGFTLIELLIVIAIIGTLATIGFLSLQSSSKNAEDAKKIAEVRSIIEAIQIEYASLGVLPGTTGANQCDPANVVFTETKNQTVFKRLANIRLNDYFVCADASDTTATKVVVGALWVSKSNNALDNDIDDNAGFIVNTSVTGAGGYTIDPVEHCGESGTDDEDQVFCLKIEK